MDSEYLVTLLVVVPLALQPDWNNRVRISSLENWAGLDGPFSFKQNWRQEAALNKFKCPYFLFSSMKSWPTWLCHGRLSWFTRWQECFYLSLTIFTQDNDHALVSVTLFQKVVDEFKTKVDVLFFVEIANGKIVCYGLSLYSRQGKTSSWSETSPTTRKLWSQVWAYTPSLLYENWEYSTFISCDYKPFFFACW